ncbi:Cof-type HAD-IIB family hydrolase [Flavobacterium sp. TMP13]|uniref:Cof-type HAD-IIB family hydrolase n=1 Tax=unclassified Flavobacterium TaxID=196869 RepID=UPI00076D9FE1|nr:Cof-type HAD-IIB family hydrolase [Flavobacterium sp. TAB 87]KVV15160.1 Pyridoxal phosphate phosphatase YigL [Flavobacterium sp. TAB 87]
MTTDFSKIKVIISDLDGTLLNQEHKISDYTKKNFKELHDKGYLIIVATGRHHMDAMAILDTLNIPIYLVSSNGARIHAPNRDELYSFNLESDVVKAALDVDIDPEITVVLFKENSWQTNRVNEKINSFQTELKYLPELVDYKQLDDFTAIKIFFSHENHEKLIHLKDTIIAKGADSLHHAFSLPTCLEFMDKSVDKRFAIERVLEKEGFTMQEAMAFGDGFNDLQMLSSTGVGLIMGNAPQSFKDVLPQLTIIGTNADDGVAQYLFKNLVAVSETIAN